jgi:hypothetical protein
MKRYRRLAVALTTATAIAAMIGTGVGAQQVGRAPLEVRVMAAPVPAAALGRTHLAWEVHVTSLGTAPVAIENLEVRDEAGAPVGAWTGLPLRQRLMAIGQSGGDPSAPISLAPGARVVAFLWVTLETGRVVPTSLTHRVSVRAPDGAIDVVAGPAVRVESAARAAVGPPVRGGTWVAVRGPSPGSGHRLSLVASDGVVRVPQRFAVDWVRLGEDGRLFTLKGTDVADWPGYDTPVVAVADGTVVLVRDGMADTLPRTPPPAIIEARDAPGNVVVIDIGEGRYATYAHLKAGSITVKEGERVQSAQPIARIGNSGNSLGPHLHFHIADAVEPLGGEGLPFALERFELVGRVPGLAPMLAGSPWVPQANQPPRMVAAELPLENMVVRFDGAP